MSGYTYKEQLEMVGSVKINEGEKRRGDCPFCGGKNTFTITKQYDVVLWGCFRASCHVSGSKKIEPSVTSVMNKVKGESPEHQYYPVPYPLTGIHSHDDIVEWLKSVHAYDAYMRALVNIKYSPTTDRIMFECEGGWIGKSLTKKPKWQKFLRPLYFKAGCGKVAVLVEDAPSACAVGMVGYKSVINTISTDYTGFAILGTYLTTEQIIALRKYEKVLICLDPDANDKALDMHYQLSFVDTRVVMIPDDLKNFSPEKIKEILDE